MKPVLKYPGSKWNIANWIISHMPEHTTYLEPYFGSGAVFFRKHPVKSETINDINDDVINLFQVLREHGEQLISLVELTPWARREYEESYIKTGDPVEDARRFLVRCWQAYGTKLNRNTGWRNDIQGSRGVHITKQWSRLPERMAHIVERLKQVQIECRPAVEVIRRLRYPEVLIYADPPYPLSTRQWKLYSHEMTDQDHLELLDALDNHPGPVLLSSYENELYAERFRGGQWVKKTKKALAERGHIREEVLWLNSVAARENISLFQGV